VGLSHSGFGSQLRGFATCKPNGLFFIRAAISADIVANQLKFENDVWGKLLRPAHIGKPSISSD
jgi:hypothetical protein